MIQDCLISYSTHHYHHYHHVLQCLCSPGVCWISPGPGLSSASSISLHQRRHHLWHGSGVRWVLAGRLLHACWICVSSSNHIMLHASSLHLCWWWYSLWHGCWHWWVLDGRLLHACWIRVSSSCDHHRVCSSSTCWSLCWGGGAPVLHGLWWQWLLHGRHLHLLWRGALLLSRILDHPATLPHYWYQYFLINTLSAGNELHNCEWGSALADWILRSVIMIRENEHVSRVWG